MRKQEKFGNGTKRENSSAGKAAAQGARVGAAVPAAQDSPATAEAAAQPRCAARDCRARPSAKPAAQQPWRLRRCAWLSALLENEMSNLHALLCALGVLLVGCACVQAAVFEKGWAVLPLLLGAACLAPVFAAVREE